MGDETLDIYTGRAGQLTRGDTVAVMISKEQFQGKTAQPGDGWTTGPDHHPVGCFGGTGSNGLGRPFNLHKAETAGAERLNPRVMAEIGDVDPCFFGCCQDSCSFFDRYLSPVDCQCHSCHLISSPRKQWLCWRCRRRRLWRPWPARPAPRKR